jgi:hypothetical protein
MKFEYNSSQIFSWYQSIRPTPTSALLCSCFQFLLIILLSMAAANPNTTQSALIKLETGNYTSWVTQINPILRTHDLMGIVDGSEPCPQKHLTDSKGEEILNPEYLIWNKKDQYLLSVITSSLSEKFLAIVYGLNTSHQAWTALATKFASKSKSRIANLKKQL